MSKVFFVVLLLGTLASCGIHPKNWTPQQAPIFKGDYEVNNRLLQAKVLDLQNYYGAEDFAVDTVNGDLYCGVHRGEKDFSSGAIMKIDVETNQVEVFLQTEHWVTGMELDANGDLIALMNNVGLVKIHKDKTVDTLLTQGPSGEPLLMGAGLTIASDGTIYFVNMSSQQSTSPKYINKLILEMQPRGGLYAYYPSTGNVWQISKGNYFGNGLALSKDESFILLSETSKYRILKYKLTGEEKGKSAIFMDNMHGFPNNITRRANGGFWIGFTTKRNEQLDKIHPKVGMKKFLYSLPSFLQPKATPFGMVTEIRADGKVEQVLMDAKGTVVKEAGAVIEYDGYLYLGGDVVKYVSKIKL